METKETKGTLSKVKPEFNFHFTCSFDKGVDVEKEVAEARIHCGVKSPMDVVCAPAGEWNATVSGGSYFKETNKRNVECVHSYLLEHGWQQEEEKQIR